MPAVGEMARSDFPCFAHKAYRHESKIKSQTNERYMLQRTEISYYSKYFAQAEDSASYSTKFNSNRIDGII